MKGRKKIAYKLINKFLHINFPVYITFYERFFNFLPSLHTYNTFVQTFRILDFEKHFRITGTKRVSQ